MTYTNFTSYTLEFNNSSIEHIQYPIPSFETAIKTLRPTVVHWEIDQNSFLIWEDSEGNDPPTWEEIHQEIKREVEIFNNYWYHRCRIEKYPPVEVQLDMLYHDIKNGNIENGKWIRLIDSIKNTHPKSIAQDMIMPPSTPN